MLHIVILLFLYLNSWIPYTVVFILRTILCTKFCIKNWPTCPEIFTKLPENADF
jgi:hypothetical protein